MAISISAGAVTLRSWGGADIPFVFDSAQDPEIARWTDLPQPYTAADAARFVSWAAARLEAGEAWHLAIVDTDRGELLGSVGAKEVVADRVELGYWLAREARGRGVATTALNALASWCFAHLPVRVAWCRIARANVASQAVARRAGFAPAGVIEGGCHDGDQPDDALVFERVAG